MSAVLDRVFRESRSRERALQAGLDLAAVRADLERRFLELEREVHSVPDPTAVLKREILGYLDMWMVNEAIDDVSGQAEDVELSREMTRLLTGHTAYPTGYDASIVGSLGCDVLRRYFVGNFGDRGLHAWWEEYRSKIFERTAWLERAISVQKDLQVPDAAIVAHWRRLEESDHASAMKTAE